jgi:L-aspartate oxidase
MVEHEDMTCDVVIAGCGVAGLYAALNLPQSMSVVMLSKGAVDECDSMLAQGGICVLPEAGDYDSFFEDTLRAGHYENRRESVDTMIRSSRSVINDLIALGVDFERKQDGSLDFTREGAHARPRIAYHADITGKEITTKLLAAVRRLGNVRILEHVAMVDILEEEGACMGVLVLPVSEEGSCVPADELEGEASGIGKVFEIRAANTIWATGGIGGVYAHSTNYPQLTGDACYIATKHGIRLEHLDYVQIHPTGLFSEQPGRTFLISESCRGEGAVLLNAAGERFTDELQPRDVVAAAISEQMKEDGTEHEWLSFDPVPREVVRGHFANIRERCLEDGRDILEEPIPVVPTQHYFMGGVWVDGDSATSMPNLYAAGETSCNGVHGRNRLASNSLLESLVFARRAAHKLLTGESLPVEEAGEPALDGHHRACGTTTLAIDALCKED